MPRPVTGCVRMSGVADQSGSALTLTLAYDPNPNPYLNQKPSPHQKPTDHAPAVLTAPTLTTLTLPLASITGGHCSLSLSREARTDPTQAYILVIPPCSTLPSPNLLPTYCQPPGLEPHRAIQKPYPKQSLEQHPKPPPALSHPGLNPTPGSTPGLTCPILALKQRCPQGLLDGGADVPGAPAGRRRLPGRPPQIASQEAKA